MAQDNTVVMEDVRIIFRNFTGKQTPFNQPGDRNFGVLLSDEDAQKMAEDGWNVKWLEPRDREDAEAQEPQPWLPVALKYRDRMGNPLRPPRVVLVTSRKRTNLDENTVETLDWVNIKKVDLIVRPSHWEMNDKSGVKAYLQSLYVTIEEDYLEQKYGEYGDNE